jgi:hypothetical protein
MYLDYLSSFGYMALNDVASIDDSVLAVQKQH